jgi:hypothetical protein
MVIGREPRGGRWVLAGFGIFLTSIEAYPFWALVIVGIDVLVIYGLAAYGDRLDRPGTPA